MVEQVCHSFHEERPLQVTCVTSAIFSFSKLVFLNDVTCLFFPTANPEAEEGAGIVTGEGV